MAHSNAGIPIASGLGGGRERENERRIKTVKKKFWSGGLVVSKVLRSMLARLKTELLIFCLPYDVFLHPVCGFSCVMLYLSPVDMTSISKSEGLSIQITTNLSNRSAYVSVGSSRVVRPIILATVLMYFYL